MGKAKAEAEQLRRAAAQARRPRRHQAPGARKWIMFEAGHKGLRLGGQTASRAARGAARAEPSASWRPEQWLRSARRGQTDRGCRQAATRARQGSQGRHRSRQPRCAADTVRARAVVVRRGGVRPLHRVAWRMFVHCNDPIGRRVPADIHTNIHTAPHAGPGPGAQRHQRHHHPQARNHPDGASLRRARTRVSGNVGGGFHSLRLTNLRAGPSHGAPHAHHGRGALLPPGEKRGGALHDPGRVSPARSPDTRRRRSANPWNFLALALSDQEC